MSTAAGWGWIFSLERSSNDGQNKCLYHVYHVWWLGLDLENRKDFFERFGTIRHKITHCVASLHGLWQEILQENDIYLLHHRWAWVHYCVHYIWFLDPVNERFKDYQAKYDIIVVEPELFLKLWTKNSPASVQPECACWDNLDHTSGDACYCSTLSGACYCTAAVCELAGDCCIFGQWPVVPATASAASCVDDTAGARKIRRAVPCDTLCPVVPHASTLLFILVILWPPLSQQQSPAS